MQIVWIVVKLVGGFILLIKGADFLVDGAGSLAKRFNVSELVIGLTIVSFGTSAPELIVNGIASFQGKNEIVLGNVIGSNIFNIFLILGVAGLIRSLSVQRSTVWREIPFSFLAVLLLGIMTVEAFLIGGPDASGAAVISRLDGAILLVLFAGFIIYAFKIARVGVFDEVDVSARGPGLTILFIAGGLVGLALGGRFVVNAAVDAASRMGVSERLIAITVVSAGTSLPELFTSAVAAFRGRNEIAVGNVVGSNIFNIMLILGVSAVIGPVPFGWDRFGIDLAVLTAATLLLFLTMFTGRRKVLDRWEAAIFVACFAGYITWLVISG